MSRIRTIKPDFFLNEDIAELSLFARLTFIGLWTIADREGRLEDRPKRIKAQLFPYDDCDMNVLLQELHCAPSRFILRYVAQDCAYIQVRNFTKHQRITGTEAQSATRIPPPQEGEIIEYQPSVDAQNGNNMETPCKQQGNILEDTGNAVDDWKGYIGKEGNGEKDKCAFAQAHPRSPVVSFDSEFWPLYPNKKDKDRARKSWVKLNPDEGLIGVIITAINNQEKEKAAKLEANIFCPDWPMPSTWLNNRRWEDEIKIPSITTTQGNTNGTQRPINSVNASQQQCAELKARELAKQAAAQSFTGQPPQDIPGECIRLN